MFTDSSLLLSLNRHTGSSWGAGAPPGALWPLESQMVSPAVPRPTTQHLHPPCPPGTVGDVAWPVGGPVWSRLECTHTSGLGQSKTLVDPAPSPGRLGAPGYQQAWLLGRRGTKNKLQKASLLGPPLSCYDNRAQGPHHAALTLGRAAGLKEVWEGDPRFCHSPAAEPPPTAFFLQSSCFPVTRPLLHAHESLGTKPPNPAKYQSSLQEKYRKTEEMSPRSQVSETPVTWCRHCVGALCTCVGKLGKND